MLKLRLSTVVAALVAMLVSAAGLGAQGVTTSQMAGTVKTPTGAGMAGVRVTAVHQPSGTTYQAISRADGRYFIPGMRVGGPYAVTAQALGFEKQTQGNIFIQLGNTAEIDFKLATAAVQLSAVAVTAQTGVLSEGRTGAATTVAREALQQLPTISRQIGDFTRLTPQASGTSFAGMDGRQNNISVDGSYFNNSFGLGNGQPGGRTGVSPISLDAIDQIQVNIAPYDVRQGNFVGANVNSVTRSGTNSFEGSVYSFDRSKGWFGKNANGSRITVGNFNYSNYGGRIGGPIIKDKLFFFVSYEKEEESSLGHNFLANPGGVPNTGNMTRVLESDVTGFSSFLQQNFGYATGPYGGYNLATPSERILTKLDWNVSTRNKVSVRYLELMSDAGTLVSNSSSLGFGNRRTNNNALAFENGNYGQGEYIRSLVGEWNSQFGSNMSNNLIVGYTSNDESRTPRGDFFPLIEIQQAGTTYLSAGSEPFTPNNELRYRTIQLQNNFQIFTAKHDLTFGVTYQKYHSENIFFPGKQSVYVYNSLQDFYTDALDFKANPTRTTSPVALRRFQVRYSNIPGQEIPVQPLDVVYAGAYVQDEWRPKTGLKITAGIRADIPWFNETGIANPEVPTFSFRDENGAAVTYDTKRMPAARILWSPRLGFNWDVKGDRSTQLRGGIGVFTGTPLFVWVSNQIGNNGMLTGFDELDNTRNRPFNPNPNAYKPATVTGAPAAAYQLALTQSDYRFPQQLRTNLAVDQKLPWGFVGTFEAILGRDVNGQYYINANLPAADSRFTGADARARWVSDKCPTITGTQTNRINCKISDATVIKNQDIGRSYVYSASLEKAFSGGLFIKGAYSYGLARNTVDPGSIAFGSWQSNPTANDPNNPGLGISNAAMGSRAFGIISWRRNWLKIGASTVSLYVNTSQFNTSYVFSNDANGDGNPNNDLLYVPRNANEMNFTQYTAGTRTFTVADQRAAFEQFITQDNYLRSRRGKYAERGATFSPMLTRADLSISQDIGGRFLRKDNNLQVRLDIVNFTNMINPAWGVSKQFIGGSNGNGSLSPLTFSGVDANGAMTYTLRNVGGNLMTRSWVNGAGLGDVYRMQLGVRYSFY